MCTYTYSRTGISALTYLAIRAINRALVVVFDANILENLVNHRGWCAQSARFVYFEFTSSARFLELRTRLVKQPTNPFRITFVGGLSSPSPHSAHRKISDLRD